MTTMPTIDMNLQIAVPAVSLVLVALYSINQMAIVIDHRTTMFPHSMKRLEFLPL